MVKSLKYPHLIRIIQKYIVILQYWSQYNKILEKFLYYIFKQDLEKS